MSRGGRRPDARIPGVPRDGAMPPAGMTADVSRAGVTTAVRKRWHARVVDARSHAGKRRDVRVPDARNQGAANPGGRNLSP